MRNSIETVNRYREVGGIGRKAEMKSAMTAFLEGCGLAVARPPELDLIDTAVRPRLAEAKP